MPRAVPVDARRYPRHDAHRMIEEFMLLANEAVAQFFTRKKIPTIYRIHDEPDPLKLEIFAEVARTFGLLKPKDVPTPEHLNAMLDKIRGGPLEAMINTMLLRSLKRAEYSAENIGHSGLALQDYLHFTSPIRRYPGPHRPPLPAQGPARRAPARGPPRATWPCWPSAPATPSRTPPRPSARTTSGRPAC